MSDTKTPAPSTSATVPPSSVPTPSSSTTVPSSVPVAKSSGKKATPPAKNPDRNTAVVTWEPVEEQADAITNNSSIFNRDIRDNADDKNGNAIMDRIRECIKDHSEDKKATNFNAQETIWTSAKDGNKTVDYQGTRAGGNAFFIDIQGQQGKGPQRKTYWQIMVQTCMGVPSDEDIIKAITASNNAKLGTRSVLHQQKGPLPNSRNK